MKSKNAPAKPKGSPTSSAGGMAGVEINKKIKLRYYKFTDVFKGFEDVDAVKKIFGKNTKKVISELKVMLVSTKWGYLWVDDRNLSYLPNQLSDILLFHRSTCLVALLR